MPRAKQGPMPHAPQELATLFASDPRMAGATIVTAPMLPRLIMRPFAMPSLIAHVASDKFGDDLPLHRQEGRLARLGVPIDHATMRRCVDARQLSVRTPIVLSRPLVAPVLSKARIPALTAQELRHRWCLRAVRGVTP